MSRSISIVLAMALVGAGGVQVANAQVFTDGFEDPTLDPYWSTIEESGSIELSSDGQVHDGCQAVQFNSTYNTGDKKIWLVHDYGQPMYGRVSVWLYDTGADAGSSNWLWFQIHQPGVIGQIGGGDGDVGGETYLAGFSGTGEYTEIDRTQDWHLFEMEAVPNSTTLWIDGTEVAIQLKDTPFQSVRFGMFAPTWRPAWVSYWDDFEADVWPADTCSPGDPAPDDSICNGIDDDCDGEIDEEYVPTETTCGTGVCESSGQLICVDGAEADTCLPKPPGCAADLDCDGDVDAADLAQLLGSWGSCP